MFVWGAEWLGVCRNWLSYWRSYKYKSTTKMLFVGSVSVLYKQIKQSCAGLYILFFFFAKGGSLTYKYEITTKERLTRITNLRQSVLVLCL